MRQDRKNPDSNYLWEYESTYDAATKTWSGSELRRYYDKNCSMGRLFFEELRRRPKNICQISDTEHTELTNEDVLKQGIRVALFFKAEGVKQSDIVGLVAGNTTHLAAVVLGCAFHGVAFHAVSPYYDSITVKILFDLTKPKLIFCDGNMYETVANITEEYKPKIFTFKDHIKGVPNVRDILQHKAGEEKYQPAILTRGTEQTFAILNSSGSTGLPKATTFTNSTRMYGYSHYLTDQDVIHVSSTIDWISGLRAFILGIIYGCTRIISDRPYSPEYFLQLVEKYKITYTMFAPSHMSMLANCPATTAEKLKSLRYLIFGGSKCLQTTHEKMRSFLTNGRLIFVYGFSEFGMGVTLNNDLARKPKATGRLMSGVKCRIICEDGKAMGPGEMGEIYCYHDDHWNGYYNNEEATRAMRDADGWFHSGDIGYFDDDHYLHVVDRKKDLLKYHAFHYCPIEIEEVIAEMPEVVDVCVFGVWSEIDEDAAAAAVLRKPGSSLTADDVIDYVYKRVEVDYKRLNAGAIILDDFPRTLTGKVNRRAIKQIFMHQRGPC